MTRTCTFRARNAREAVNKIRETLGPSAVVLQVRKVPAPGLARWLGRPWIEVVAAVPEPEATPQTSDVLEELKRELAELRSLVERRQAPAAAPGLASGEEADCPAEPGELTDFLMRLGLLPRYARQLAMSAKQAEMAPAQMTSRQMLAVVQKLLQQQWRVPPPLNRENLQVFIGPPGVGKTTALCKWLARLVLRENQAGRVWYADGDRPNLAEALRFHAELLGVPVERVRGNHAPISRSGGEAWQFVDMPGVPWQNAAVLETVRQRVAAWGPVQCHLVLSAAYDTALLLQQVRAFSSWPLAGVIVTHVDEQPALGKLWNLLCGTNCTVRFLAGGQNIPGEFVPATPAALGPAILWAETGQVEATQGPAVAGKASAMQNVADW